MSVYEIEDRIINIMIGTSKSPIPQSPIAIFPSEIQI